MRSGGKKLHLPLAWHFVRFEQQSCRGVLAHVPCVRRADSTPASFLVSASSLVYFVRTLCWNQ